LFIDEIHRFNKAQQDFLLPFVEKGDIILIGATTESPYHEVNKALISRSTLFELKRLEKKDILNILNKALEDKVDGLGTYNVNFEDNSLEIIADYCEGDARNALNTLELAVLTTRKNRQTGFIDINKNIIENCMQKKALKYDKDGTNHYDTISAFIKSMRGSNPQAVNFYLAQMLESGEDIRFIARRIVICASEDVGNADPMALVLANNAAQAVERIGMPEARIILSQAATYIACAPKSNSSYLAINKCIDFIQKNGTQEVPSHLRDGGFGYQYAHNGENHFVEQQYLPTKIKDERFFEITEQVKEKEFKEYAKKIGNKYL
jgi:putative ATPase